MTIHSENHNKRWLSKNWLRILQDNTFLCYTCLLKLLKDPIRQCSMSLVLSTCPSCRPAIEASQICMTKVCSPVDKAVWHIRIASRYMSSLTAKLIIMEQHWGTLMCSFPMHLHVKIGNKVSKSTLHSPRLAQLDLVHNETLATA